MPILIVEVLSPTTRRRDREHKRAFYMEAGIPEYWVVDPFSRELRVVCPDRPDTITTTELRWHPAGASAPLTLGVESIFGDDIAT